MIMPECKRKKNHVHQENYTTHQILFACRKIVQLYNEVQIFWYKCGNIVYHNDKQQTYTVHVSFIMHSIFSSFLFPFNLLRR